MSIESMYPHAAALFRSNLYLKKCFLLKLTKLLDKQTLKNSFKNANVKF